MNFPIFLTNCQQRIEQVLEKVLPPVTCQPEKLHQAIRYAVLQSGKRVRPVLVYAVGELLAIPGSLLDCIAAAVELIHCYSLVHDDLPAIDNDDLRRGRATCHKAFDEATAILVGDALQNFAFQVVADFSHPQLPASEQVLLIKLLAYACNTRGMVGGQALDLAATGQQITFLQLTEIHRLKTGALIKACIEMPLSLATVLPQSQREQLLLFAEKIGLAYQIQDDILDVIGNTSTLGKTVGKDQKLGKSTYPSMIGMSEAKKILLSVYDDAISLLHSFDHSADYLRALARLFVERIN